MIKTLKKILLSSVSILGISLLLWIVLLLNPSLSYANHTAINNVSIYHNLVLEDEVEVVIKNAINIIKRSEIYESDLKIQFCLNDDKFYPKLYPFGGATAYAFLNKTVIYDSWPSFKNNYTEFKWKVNNNELRKYNLTALLAHEFMHNLQYNFNANYQIKSTLGRINWKLEGHAEYISREFKNDNKLIEKIENFLIQVDKEHVGVPVFYLADGTIQNLSYYKYALSIQYLMEVKNLNFEQVCELDSNLEMVYSEMIDWTESTNK